MINEFMIIYLLINLCNTHNYCIVICQKWRQQNGVHFDNSLQEYLNCRLRWLKGSSGELFWSGMISRFKLQGADFRRRKIRQDAKSNYKLKL